MPLAPQTMPNNIVPGSRFDFTLSNKRSYFYCALLPMQTFPDEPQFALYRVEPNQRVELLWISNVDHQVARKTTNPKSFSAWLNGCINEAIEKEMEINPAETKKAGKESWLEQTLRFLNSDYVLVNDKFVSK